MRGVSAHGHSANYVETEQLVEYEDSGSQQRCLTSFVQVDVKYLTLFYLSDLKQERNTSCTYSLKFSFEISPEFKLYEFTDKRINTVVLVSKTKSSLAAGTNSKST